MAPKGGGGGRGGGGKGGGAGSCHNCNRPLTLNGSDWESPLNVAYFAVNVLIAVIIVLCLILNQRFIWKSLTNGIDKRRSRYRQAASYLLISYILAIIDLALHESNHHTTHFYYLINVLISVFWRLADIYILVVIYRTLQESSLSNLARKLDLPQRWSVMLIALISVMAWSFYVVMMVNVMEGETVSQVVDGGYRWLNTIYHVTYLGLAALIGFTSFGIWKNDKDKTNLLTLALTSTSLILRHLASLLLAALSLYLRYSSSKYNTPDAIVTTQWACAFIAEITNAGIYLGIVVVGWLLYREGRSDKERGVYVGGTANGQFDSGVGHNQGGQKGWKRWLNRR